MMLSCYMYICFFFFFKQKTAYEMRISDWSSDVCSSDLLDEPTNHLDLAAIDWLESWLARYTGAFVAISHDRTFLTRLTRQTLWLDRGSIRRKEIGFGGFEEWSDAVAAEEARAAQRLDSKLRLEAHWLERGVTEIGRAHD